MAVLCSFSEAYHTYVCRQPNQIPEKKECTCFKESSYQSSLDSVRCCIFALGRHGGRYSDYYECLNTAAQLESHQEESNA